MNEKFEDTKGVITKRTSKNGRKYNGQQKKVKRTSNDLQNTTDRGNTNLTSSFSYINIQSESRICSHKVTSVIERPKNNLFTKLQSVL